MWGSLENLLDLLIAVGVVGGAIVQGVGSLIYGLDTIEKSDSSMSWRKFDGEILSSGLVEETCHTASLDLFTRNVAEVKYQYIIDGERYQSSRVSFDDRVYSLECERILSSYPRGKLVNVYVDPVEQKQVVLEPGSGGGPAVFGVILGIVFILIGVWAACRVPSLISQMF